MQSIDHKGLCVKCDNAGHLGAIGYSHIYSGNLDFKGWVWCVLQILLFIGSATTMTQGNSWINLISMLLLLFIELDKTFLGIYVIYVIDCIVVIKSAIVHTACIGLKVICISHAFVNVFILSICLLLLHFNISSGMNSVSDTCKLCYFMIIKRFSM